MFAIHTFGVKSLIFLQDGSLPIANGVAPYKSIYEYIYLVKL